MTREQKIAKARRRRDEGLSLQKIAEELGVTASCIWKWLNPERCREQTMLQNAKRNAAKRQWAREHRAECPQCGGEMGAGSGSPSRRRRICAECVSDNARARTVRYIELRKRGMRNPQIAEVEKTTTAGVTTTLSGAYRYGLTVPRSPYWERGRAK